MTSRPIYLDAFSTTPLAPEALAAMQVCWARPGNASSPHAAGQQALASLDRGRRQVADLIGCEPSELIFTSGATEANNLVLRGLADWALKGGSPRRRVVMSAVEHKAVLETGGRLAASGFEIMLAPVDRDGRVDVEQLSALVDDNTLLVSVMLVNNETGVVQPIEEIGHIARSQGALLHSDGAQAVGKAPIDVATLGVDYLSISAHKFYGPMGIGALFLAAEAPKPVAQISGGGQERGIRAGTEPVPLVAGFGAAAEAASRAIEEDSRRSADLKDRFLKALKSAGVAHRCITHNAPVIAGGLALSFPGINADDLVSRVARSLCISTGSACTSGQVMPSHVLKAMGLSHEEAETVIRLFFHRFVTPDDVTLAAGIIAKAVDERCSALDGVASRG